VCGCRAAQVAWKRTKNQGERETNKVGDTYGYISQAGRDGCMDDGTRMVGWWKKLQCDNKTGGGSDNSNNNMTKRREMWEDE
jgi:hypothetical protein